MFMYGVTDESEGAVAVAAAETGHVRALIGEVANEARGASAPGSRSAAAEDDDLIGLYLHEIGKIPLLTARQEVEIGRRIEKCLEDRSARSAEEALLDHDRVVQVQRALATLPPREQSILRLRFGIGGGDEHTLDEIGRQFGVTRERVRQIEAEALGKLRSPLRGRNLQALVGN